MANQLLQDIINEMYFRFPDRESWITKKERNRRKKLKKISNNSKRKNRGK